MRIIAGTQKGARIFSPPGIETRPTPDRIREDLFNILDIQLGGQFLDIFAGTGAVGIEAMSRGAQATFIEKSKAATVTLQKNLIQTKFNATIIRSSAKNAIKNIYKNDLFTPFDYIFLDPPFNMGLVGPTMDILAQYDILKPQGIIVVEMAIREPLVLKNQKIESLVSADGSHQPSMLEKGSNQRLKTSFILIKEKKYSKEQLLFFVKENEGEK